MKVVAIIQARMGSTRLPGKVMKLLMDHTVLHHVVSRVKEANNIDEIIVATTHLPKDDPIDEEARKAGANVFRGDEQDVLSRYYQAAAESDADIIIRITSDCPLIDSAILSNMLEFYQQNNYDYVSNTLSRTFPRGLDVEIFSFQALEKAYNSASLPEEREHVTPYLYRHPTQFSLYDYRSDEDHSDYRWTLDTIEDWELIHKLYQHLYDNNRLFGLDETLKFLQCNPELSQINAHVEQKKLEDAIKESDKK